MDHGDVSVTPIYRGCMVNWKDMHDNNHSFSIQLSQYDNMDPSNETQIQTQIPLDTDIDSINWIFPIKETSNSHHVIGFKELYTSNSISTALIAFQLFQFVESYNFSYNRVGDVDQPIPDNSALPVIEFLPSDVHFKLWLNDWTSIALDKDISMSFFMNVSSELDVSFVTSEPEAHLVLLNISSAADEMVFKLPSFVSCDGVFKPVDLDIKLFERLENQMVYIIQLNVCSCYSFVYDTFIGIRNKTESYPPTSPPAVHHPHRSSIGISILYGCIALVVVIIFALLLIMAKKMRHKNVKLHMWKSDLVPRNNVHPFSATYQSIHW